MIYTHMDQFDAFSREMAVSEVIESEESEV